LVRRIDNEYKTEISGVSHPLQERQEMNGEDIIIYDYLINIAYFSVASVSLWLIVI